MEQNEAELIDYLKVIWKRKGLIIGGTLVAAATALVLSLSTPKTYEVSRTLKIGNLPLQARIYEGRKIEDSFIEHREAVIGRLKDDRVLKMVMEKVHSELGNMEMGGEVSIDTKTNPNVRYMVQSDDPQGATRIADRLAGYIIKVHKPSYGRALQIAKEYEAELTVTIRKVGAEIQSMRMILKNVMKAPKVDAPAVILLQANAEDRERNLADIRRELKVSRLSRLRSENTSVITAGPPPKHPIKPNVKLNVILTGTLGLMMFTFIAFFLEYIEKAKGKG